MKHFLKSKLLQIFAPILLVGIILASSSYFLYQTEKNSHISQAHSDLEKVGRILEYRINQTLLSLDGLRAFFVASDGITIDEFYDYTNIVYQANIQSGIDLTLEWIDQNNTITFVYPPTDVNQKIIGTDLNQYPNRLLPINQAKQENRIIATEPLILGQGAPGVVIYNPIFHQDKYLGMAVGVITLPSLLEQITWENPYFPHINYQSESRQICQNGKEIYDFAGNKIINPAGEVYLDASPSCANNNHSSLYVIDINFANRIWKISLNNADHTITHFHYSLIYIIIIVIAWTIFSILFIKHQYQQFLISKSAEKEHKFNQELIQQKKLVESQNQQLIDQSQKLQEKTNELKHINNFMIDREIRMNELKETIKNIKNNDK